MDWIIAIVIGGIMGWVASLIMNTDAEQGTLANIVIGVVGAALGRWIFGGLLGIGSAASAGALSLYGLLWGIVGAVVLIGILKAVHVLR